MWFQDHVSLDVKHVSPANKPLYRKYLLSFFLSVFLWRMIQQVERSYGSCVCSLLALHAGLEKVLYRSVVLTWLFSPLKNKNTLSWVDRKAGHTGGFRYPCSDPHVRPCSHTYTHGVPLYLPVLTLQKSFIKTQLIHSRVSSLFSSSMLCCWEVRCRGEAGLGQHAAGGVSRAVGGQGADVVLCQEGV